MNNPASSASKAAPGRGGRRRRRTGPLPALLVLLAVLILLLFLVFRQDRVTRFFRYMGLQDREGYGRIHYEGGAGSVFAGFDDGLLIGTENSLSLFGLDGAQKLLLQGSLPTPVLRTGKDLSFIFSPGSAYVAAIGAGGKILTDESLSGAVINADVSFDGYTAYITTEDGYKSIATVLNTDRESIYRFSSRTRYLNACAVSEQGKYLAVAQLEEENGVYRSAITILPTDQPFSDLEQDDSGATRLELGNQMVYALHFLDQTHLMAIAQDSILFLDINGEKLNELPTRINRLTDYAISTDNWVIVALEQNGSDSRVLTLDAAGNPLGTLDLAGRVRSVSAAEGYAAVLTERYVQTFDRNLSAYDRSWDVLSSSRAIARPDGTVLLVGNSETKLFIP